MQFFNKKFFFTLFLCAALVGNVVLAFLLVNNVYATNRANQTRQINLKILSFTSLFIEKVLMSSQEVDFNTRLTLETMVRNLNDPDILGQWQKFTQDTNQQDAGNDAKVLLDLLVKKINY